MYLYIHTRLLSVHCIYIATPKWRYSVAVVCSTNYIDAGKANCTRATTFNKAWDTSFYYFTIISHWSCNGMERNVTSRYVPKNPCNVGEQDQDLRRYHATYLIGTRGPHCDNFVETNLRPFLTFPYGETTRCH